MNIPCQDAHLYRVLPHGELLIAVADGAGSAARSKEGAERAIEQVAASLEVALKEQSPEDEVGWKTIVVEAFCEAREALVQLAMAENDSLRSFSTTLTCAIVSDRWLVVGQIGDGVAVAETSTGAMFVAVRPQRGEYANEAYFLTMSDALQYVEVQSYAQQPRALAVTTDGLLRLALKLPEYEPHPPFFQPLIAFVTEAKDDGQAKEQLITFLCSDRVCARTDDDKTLVLATCSIPSEGTHTI